MNTFQPNTVEDTRWADAQRYLAGSVSTISKHPSRFVGGYPTFIREGQGCFIEDHNGNLYTDYICSLGPIILGHNFRSVSRAVKERIDKGTLFSQSNIEEVHLAKTLNRIIPSADKVKYFKDGSSANSAAIRLVRAVTGKSRILVCGYHGWHDWYQYSNPQNRGINPQPVTKFTYNDKETLRQAFDIDDVAAIIMEPMRFEEPKDGFLEYVRDIAHEHGALFILDEVITGFRFHLGGAQSYFGVLPDLSTFSKAMGNGYPIAALCGREKYMSMFDDPNLFVSGTFGGDLIGITAAQATIAALEDNYQSKVKTIWKSGNELRDGYNLIGATLNLNTRCEGLGPLTRFTMPSVEHKGLFYQLCIKEGLMFGPTNFINASHGYIVVQQTLNKIEGVLSRMKEVWDNPKSALIGNPPHEIVLR